MVRLQPHEIEFYIELDMNDPFICQKATAYTSTPNPLDPKWDDIKYYTQKPLKYTSMWKTQDNTRVRVDY